MHLNERAKGSWEIQSDKVAVCWEQAAELKADINTYMQAKVVTIAHMKVPKRRQFHYNNLITWAQSPSSLIILNSVIWTCLFSVSIEIRDFAYNE